MISIVISSVNKRLLDNVTENIRTTIGVPYEVLAYDNSQGKSGICEIYNKGATQAAFDTLCYMHEDVKINTLNWGNLVINTFQKHPGLGLLGIAGTTYKPWMPSGWGHAGLNELKLQRVNLIQHFKGKEEAKLLYENPFDENLAIVNCIDGLWFCTPRKIAMTIGFNDKSLKGFHGYDLDYSLAVGQQYGIAVTFEIILEHFSEGKFDEDWLKDTIEIHKAYERLLPKNVAGLSKNDSQKVEKRVFKELISQFKASSFPMVSLLTYIKKAKQAKVIDYTTSLQLYWYWLRSL